MTPKFTGLALVLTAGLLGGSASATPVLCQDEAATGCWRQITYTNFKAVGDGLVCTVGGNVQPSGDAYQNPNNHSDNQGNEDIVECHKPSGVSGISSEPFFPGYGSTPNSGSRVPGGIFDYGVWGGTPTGVITLYGPGGDDVAVLNSQQQVYVSTGDRNNFKTGNNYVAWQLDRMNVHADTGATLCLKGLFTTVAPTGNTWWLMALGCSGETYAAHEAAYVGWLPQSTLSINDAGGGNQWWYGLTPSNLVHRETYRYSEDMPALPSGTPKYVGFRYVISTTNNRIYEASPSNSLWTFRDVDYPESQDPQSTLGQIDSGERFRGVTGEFFVHQSFNRVYLYYPAPVASVPLTDAQIGGATGSRVENLTQETMTSRGGDIYSSADMFTYAYKTFSGDGVAITKVLSQTAQSGALDPYAKAGLMIRETTAANSANVFLGKTPSGATIQQRVTASANTTVTNVSAPALPVWFRLIRTRNSFIGSQSSDGTTWTQIGDPVVFTNFLASPLVGLGVSSHSATAVAQAVFDSGVTPEPRGFQWEPGLTSLRSPWLDATMGMTGGSHDRDTVAHTETITASGADIYDYSDQFFYAFQNVTGNATIVAKVTGLIPVAPATTVHAYAKAGIMFRDSATGGAPNAFVAITAAQGGTFQYRAIAGNATPTPSFMTSVGARTVNAPFWIKATRTGAQSNVYTGFVSYDGATWTQVGAPATLANIGSTALVGLAVTSHDATKSVKATFSNVAITQP
jgi:hypothetical protein